MDSVAVKDLFAQLKLSQNVVKKLIAKISDEQLDWKPANEVRSVKEIVSHFYGAGQGFVKAIQTGGLSEEENIQFESSSASNIDELLKFCDNSFDSIFNLAISLSDDELAKKVKLFYGEFSVWQLLQFYFTEFYHHYGQLTVYARMLNIVPPFAYDFE